MNNKFIIASVFAAVSGLAGLANTASAGTDIHFNIGIGARPGPVIVAPRCEPPAPVVVVPARGYGYATPAPVPSYRDDCAPVAPRGYWKEVAVKVWVPEERVRSYDRHGRVVFCVRPGYFTYRNERVWVADAGPGHHGGFGYAYGRG